MTGNSRSPSTPAVELGLQLKTERERSRPGLPRGYSKAEIPRNIISGRTLLDIEQGRKRTVRRGLVRDICAFYQTDAVLIENLVTLADATYMDDWTDAYSGAVDRDGWLYQQREDRAARLKFHDSNFIPSLIQPESYIEMIRRTTRVNFDQPAIDWHHASRFRIDRQERWLRSQRPMTCLIGEMAFAVDLGEAASKDLRNRMLQSAALPFTDIRVVPFHAGRYDLMGWELNLLEFTNGDEPLIQIKSARGSGFLPVRSHRATFFMQAFSDAWDMSIPVEEFLS